MNEHQSTSVSIATRRRKIYRLPYYEQARTWYRYARQLSGRTFDAYTKKEHALAESVRLRGRSFVLTACLEPCAGAEHGVCRLRKRIEEQGRSLVELAARIVEVDEDDPAADEVHLCIEEADPTSSRARRLVVGRLPQEDAFWVLPLLRIESEAGSYAPALQFFTLKLDTEASSEGHMHVVIARAHEAARSWLDWTDERKEHYDRSLRSTYYDERAYAQA